jgi:hypothetical protein
LASLGIPKKRQTGRIVVHNKLRKGKWSRKSPLLGGTQWVRFFFSYQGIQPELTRGIEPLTC